MRTLSPTLWLFNTDLNMYAFVDIVMLVGIVEKNAIMMIDFAIETGTPARTRFRPIMMTTMAALMGSLPIAVALSAGRRRVQPEPASVSAH